MSVISQKTQYALRAVFELAKHQGEGPVKIGRIATAQVIPQRFLENILNQLKRSGVIESRRGKEGGYLLARDRHTLTVGEVIALVQGPLTVVDCVSAQGDGQCTIGRDCVFWPMWEKARKAQMDVYNSTTFHTLIEQEARRCSREAPMYSI